MGNLNSRAPRRISPTVPCCWILLFALRYACNSQHRSTNHLMHINLQFGVCFQGINLRWHLINKGCSHSCLLIGEISRCNILCLSEFHYFSVFFIFVLFSVFLYFIKVILSFLEMYSVFLLKVIYAS